jgi:hypothetical protein
MSASALVDLIAAFLREAGFTVVEERLPPDTFLPGLAVRGDVLVFDRNALRYPGDLLHEAGHLAVLPANIRVNANPELLDAPDTEVAAIAWSYAAACHLHIPPEVVFHANGYRGNSEGLLLGFTYGVFPGLNLLEAAGLTVSPRRAAERGVAPYPAMLRWMSE